MYIVLPLLLVVAFFVVVYCIASLSCVPPNTRSLKPKLYMMEQGECVWLCPYCKTKSVTPYYTRVCCRLHIWRYHRPSLD